MPKSFKRSTFNYTQIYSVLHYTQLYSVLHLIILRLYLHIYSHSCQTIGYELHNEFIPLARCKISISEEMIIQFQECIGQDHF